MQNNSEVLNESVVRRMRDGRCRYDPQVKQKLVHQCMLSGVSMARMAMLHGVNANLLRAWISK
jgi:transposase